MNRQAFIALLVSFNLGGGRVAMPEPPPIYQGAVLTEPDKIREACMSASTPQTQFDALSMLWSFLFPSNSLNRSNAQELLRIAGSAVQVYDDLIDLQGRTIAFPFAYSKGVLSSKKGKRARGEEEPELSINAGTWNKVKEATIRHVESNNDYTDFRQHRQFIEARGTGGEEEP